MSELHRHLSTKKSNSTQHLCLPVRRHSSDTDLKTISSARFGSTYTKIGTIQRRLAWSLRKDDTQIREAFHI